MAYNPIAGKAAAAWFLSPCSRWQDLAAPAHSPHFAAKWCIHNCSSR